MLFESVQQFVVAETSDGELIGCGALHVMWEDLGEIRTLIVQDEWLHHGVGREIVEALEGNARTLGLSRLFCLTFEVDFFTRRGFTADRRAGRRPGCLLAAAAQPRRGHRGVPRPRARQAEHARQHARCSSASSRHLGASDLCTGAGLDDRPDAALAQALRSRRTRPVTRAARPPRPPRAGCRAGSASPASAGGMSYAHDGASALMRACRHCHMPHSTGQSAGAAAPPMTSRSRHSVRAGSPGAGATAIWWSQTSSAASGPVSGMPLSRKMRTGPRSSVVKRSLAWMSCRPRGSAPPTLSPTATSAPGSQRVGKPSHRGAPSRGTGRRARPPPAASAGPATRHPHRSRSRT